MELTGYTDALVVEPGGRLKCMISTEAATYDAALVRLRHGDENPHGPGLKEDVLSWPGAGAYPGRRQHTQSGSYVVVPDFPGHLTASSLTLVSWLCPTTPGKAGGQGVITQWSAEDQAGFGLFVEPEGDLALRVGDGDGHVILVRTGMRMRAFRWYFAAATFDRARREVRMLQQPLAGVFADSSGATIESPVAALDFKTVDAPLLMAAASLETSTVSQRPRPHGLYNGKLERPQVFARALDASQIAALCVGTASADVAGDDLVADWDLGAEPSTTRVVERSGRALHGEALNMPLRAATGHTWNGSTLDFKQAPFEYGAIHFHDDDLDDAGWDVDFTLEVPTQLGSGIYAVRLAADDVEDRMPFVVRPGKGAARADIAFLLPTLTYVAYANEMLADTADYSARGGPYAGDAGGIGTRPHDAYLLKHPEVGTSLYDIHSDGTARCYSSRLRPILNMRPDYRHAYTNAPRHLPADLYVVDWLHEKGHAFDVITDEDLHGEGSALLSQYKVVMTGTHPEYCTWQMLEGVSHYLLGGGRLMYLGGNGFYWVTSVDQERSHIIEVRRGLAGSRTNSSLPGEGFHSTTGEPGGLWRFRGRYPNGLVGVGWTADGFDERAPGYIRQSDSFDARASFIFEGVSDDEVIGDFGLIMGGAAGDEIDRMDYSLGSPPNCLLLASAPQGRNYFLTVDDVPVTMGNVRGDDNQDVRADMTYFEGPRGGGVFSVGSMCWCGSLSHSNYSNNVSRITENVLRHFLAHPRDPR